MFDLEYELKNLPHSPGVYLMKNHNDEVIYVGKAVSLKNRVRQYFKNKNHPPKVEAMVKAVSYFEYIMTDSEVESLILECNLIKKYRPRYNILLRDDKTYPYIKITVNEDFPRILKVRNVLKDNAKYLGPYPNVFAVNSAIEYIKNTYPIRSCNIDILRAIEKNMRPCLNYHIKKCIGPCTGKVDKKAYIKMIDEIVLFLSGKSEDFITVLKSEMEKCASNLDFENAAIYRDKINGLQEMLQKQKITYSDEKLNQDIISISKNENIAVIVIFYLREGKVLGKEHYILEGIAQVDDGELLASFMKQFYVNQVYIPNEILVQEEIEELQLMEEFLSQKKGKKVSIKLPKRGDKKDLVLMVEKNAQMELSKIINTEKNTDEKRSALLLELKEMLELKALPSRIECFDISNIQGVDSVGAMVVFTNGKKDNKEYRRYKIRSVEGPNDYASMEEVISRRLKKDKHPDLILLDGGLGHVTTVERVIKEYNLNIPVWGVYKDDKHRTEGLISSEKQIKMVKTSPIYRFVAAIQEEVHRYAISYHRSLRDKKMVKSILDDIPNVGKVSKEKLLLHFKSIDNIKTSSLEELEKVVNKKAASSIIHFFREDC